MESTAEPVGHSPRVPGPSQVSSPDGKSASMISQPSRPVVYATLLTILAGFLDAAAYSELDHLYVSFMSGNSTHLGIVLASGDLPGIVAVAVIVGAFVLGAGVGTWIADAAGTRLLASILTAEAMFLAVALALSLQGNNHPALLLVAMAMGMQNTMHQVIAGADVGKSFITGALFGLGQSIARLLRGRGKAGEVASNLLSWIAFVAGATIGTLAVLSFGLKACLLGATVLILMMLGAFLARWI
ncbi:YoaK family protein [Mesorhizobium sp. KR9-304]|uniref:YoaK family protein n=1 Tax=Mesorhizobium sp. KR9-304 TaxID=3156614 RepID=UPI0032B44A9F